MIRNLAFAALLAAPLATAQAQDAGQKQPAPAKNFNASLFDNHPTVTQKQPPSWSAAAAGYNSALEGIDVKQFSHPKPVATTPPPGGLSVPGLTDKTNVGPYRFKVEAGRDNSQVSIVPGMFNPPVEDTDNLRQAINRRSRSQFAQPYIGFSLSTPAEFFPQR